MEHALDTPPAGVVWTLEAASSAKNRQGVFLLGQQLYVFGGNNSLAQHDFGTENFVDTALGLDLGSLERKSVDAFPALRQSMQTVVTGDEDHRVGYVYDPTTNQWSTLTDKFPFASSEHVHAFAFHDELLLYTAQREGQSSEDGARG